MQSANPGRRRAASRLLDQHGRLEEDECCNWEALFIAAALSHDASVPGEGSSPGLTYQ
jgi:hypothetical protein